LYTDFASLAQISKLVKRQFAAEHQTVHNKLKLQVHCRLMTVVVLWVWMGNDVDLPVDMHRARQLASGRA